MESLKREKNCMEKLGNHGKIVQQKFWLAGMETYVDLGHDCQEGSTQDSTYG